MFDRGRNMSRRDKVPRIYSKKVAEKVEKRVIQTCTATITGPVTTKGVWLRLPKVTLSQTTMSASQYPVPPPSYGSAAPAAKHNNNYFEEREAQEPLLGSSSRGAGGYYDQPAQGDIPDDFKVCVRSRSTSAFHRLFSFQYSMARLCQTARLKFGMLSSAKSTPFFVSNCYCRIIACLTNCCLLVCQIVMSSHISSIYNL